MWYVIVGVIVLIAILVVAGFFLWKKIKEDDSLKYEFVTIVTHKFRTPLTQIKWETEAMLLSEADQEKRQNLLDMKESSEKLIGLTGTLVELLNVNNTWKTIYSFEPTSLCEYVKEVAEPHEADFRKKGITFTLICPPEPVFANIDKERLKYALQILLDNAHNYTPQGGRVDIVIEKKEAKACISVVDTGIGINFTDKLHLFTKFYRADNAVKTDTEGFGIGLFLAKSVVKRHKGKIEATSEGQNKGSTFTISLPSIPAPK